MHDIRAIRENPEAYERAWNAKGLSGRTEEILALDARLRAAQTAVQQAQAERNDASKKIGQAKARKDEAEASRLMAHVEALKKTLEEQAAVEREAGEALRGLLASLPNIPASDVPPGEDESGNVEVRRWGEPFAISNPKDHVDLGEALGMMSFERAAKMSGSRFVVLQNQLARLERAIGQFMLDLQTREHGYTEVSPPLLVRSEAMFGTGQLPKFADDQFVAIPGLENARAVSADQLDEAPELRWLIPTAEVSLTNLVRESITPEEELPLRVTALTHCFRAEAGASGRDTRGIIRQHQFQKVELVSITTPAQSEAEHERMVECAETVLKRLELPFRTMLLCAGDMGFSSRKTYDLEAWIPSEGRYREISSCSNCGDFQARRMDARCKAAGEKGTRFVHTLNGSGLAVGRTLVAVMENYQDEGGRIAIPQALQPYLPGLTHIGA
ncbi:MAG: serine--tRNA ligase [Phenylobacterium sp.]|jgi:seryl-tRNA synthetase|uniref:serine--tRNA ligase n=1 Tax=Phenylobacterium sp. TaxID=1871053 RepID=UPI002A36E323|nr:serine--tRNA ligase [Phenylobacterium sp.]MDX9997148.1 serine--tRNA ligase [Phenylobacterium sp.]